MLRRPLLTACRLLVVLSACAAGGSAAERPRGRSDRSTVVETSTSSSTTSAPPPAPTIHILTPPEGATIRGSVVPVVVSVANFAVVDEQFQAPVPGEGHVHFYLDVNPLPTTHTFPAAGIYRSISGTSYTWTGLSAGPHTLAAQLVGNDHVPLKPPARDAVTSTVTG